MLDLPQVDLMNFRVEYVRLAAKRPFLGLEAAERATKSQEVDLSRLKGFHLPFARAKNEEWRDLQLLSQITFGRNSDQNNRTCVLFSCVERPNLFTLYEQRY